MTLTTTRKVRQEWKVSSACLTISLRRGLEENRAMIVSSNEKQTTSA